MKRSRPSSGRQMLAEPSSPGRRRRTRNLGVGEFAATSARDGGLGGKFEGERLQGDAGEQRAASPSTLWQVGTPRRRSSSSMQGKRRGEV
jgi:hypothetical protein